MANEAIWYYSADGQQRNGPVSWTEVEVAYRTGIIGPDTLMWAPQLPGWVPARDLLVPAAVQPPILSAELKPSIDDAQTQQPIHADVPEPGVGISSYFWLFVNFVIFVYNCYAITNNLLIKSGYVFIAIGLIINVYIIVSFPGMFQGIFPKINKYLSFAVLGIGLILGISGGYDSRNKILEKESVSLVTQILKEQLGSEAATCKSVTIEKEISNGFYHATAHLDNGNDISIGIEDKDKEILVTIAK
jgi:hypothetical protein